MYGLKKVLSTTSATPCRRAIVATFSISTKPNVGFDGLSIQINLVSPGRMSFSTSCSMDGENDTSTPCVAATFVKYRYVPPYTSDMETTCDPRASDWTIVAVAAEPEEKARAYFAFSRDATACSKLSLLVYCQSSERR